MDAKTFAFPQCFIGLFAALWIAVFPAVSAQAADAPGKLSRVATAYTTVGGIITPVWITYEKGLFQKYGLEVTMSYVASGPVVVSALIAGELDITTGGAEPFVSTILGGADLTIIGFIARATPLMLYVAPHITQFEQLKGGTVAVSRLTSSSAYMAKVGLKMAGLEPMRDVVLIQAGGISESFAALQGGRVLGAMLSPRTTYKAEAAGFRRLWSGLGVEYPSLIISTRKAYLKGAEDTALRYLQAIAEGIHTFRNDKEEALRVMSKYTKATDRNILEKTYADNKDVHNVTLRPVSTGIKSILETLAGTSPQAAKADPEAFIDARLTNKLEESGFFKGLMSR